VFLQICVYTVPYLCIKLHLFVCYILSIYQILYIFIQFYDAGHVFVTDEGIILFCAILACTSEKFILALRYVSSDTYMTWISDF